MGGEGGDNYLTRKVFGTRWKINAVAAWPGGPYEESATGAPVRMRRNGASVATPKLGMLGPCLTLRTPMTYFNEEGSDSFFGDACCNTLTSR